MIGKVTIHLLFALSLVATGLYYVRLAGERHVLIGIHGTTDQNVQFVRSGSEAERAGLRIGDRLAHPDRSFLEGFLGDQPAYEFTIYRGADTMNVTLRLNEAASADWSIRNIPPVMRMGSLVGLLSMLLGWWVFARNPDERSIIPFALWSAATGPFWVSEIWSAYWSYEMWSLNTVWTIVVESLFQAFALHWLLIFPRRLVRRRVIVALYVTMAVLAGLLLFTAIRIGDKPDVLMSRKGMSAAGVAVVLCFIQLRRAPSLRARRQASWVFVGVTCFSLVSLLLWDAPSQIGISIPLGAASVEVIAASSYLIIPIGIAIAIMREGLFRIDRFVTRGMTIGATLFFMYLLYFGATFTTAKLAGISDQYSLPVFWGFAIACGIAVLARPVHAGIEAVVDRVFSRDRQRFTTAITKFDQGIAAVIDRKSLLSLTNETIKFGLGVSHCEIVSDKSDNIMVAPGAISAESYSGRTVIAEDLPPGVYLTYPIRIAEHFVGTAEIGAKENDIRFSDDDLLFLERLTLRCANQAARMELYDQSLRRELEFAQTRLRIAADLHDDIGSNLSGIALMTESAAGNPDREKQLHEISRFARGMVDSLRDIVWSIDPETDSSGQLVERMKDVASTMLAGISHSFNVTGRLDGSTSPVFQRNVFLIYKEAIHNVARHSRAESVQVVIHAADDEFSMTIMDDGVGFDATAQTAGLGQRTMAQRAERLGADFSVESVPGSGTRVSLRARMAQLRQ